MIREIMELSDDYIFTDKKYIFHSKRKNFKLNLINNINQFINKDIAEKIFD